MSLDSIRIEWLFDYILIFIIRIIITVGFLLTRFFLSSNIYVSFNEYVVLEFFWTLLPSFVLVFIAIPRLYTLYIRETPSIPILTLKITGNQWFWTYDITFLRDAFDSYIKTRIDEKNDVFFLRNLIVDNFVVLPINSNIRLIVLSNDVLHRWRIPVIGLKADANPGRINIIYSLRPLIVGSYFGQCREICGANHSFIPTTIFTTNFSTFIQYIYQ